MADYYVKTTGNDSTGNGTVGNPWATPGKALAEAITVGTGWRIFVETGTYAVTTASTNVASGCLSFSQSGTATLFNRIIGHAVGNTAVPAQFTMALGAGLAATVVTFSAAALYNSIQGVTITGNSTASARALLGASRTNFAQNLIVSGFTGGGTDIVSIGSDFNLSDFTITGGNTGAFAALAATASAHIERGVVSGNAGRGVRTTAGTPCFNRVKSYGHTGASGTGFLGGAGLTTYYTHCIAANNNAGGFVAANNTAIMALASCISDAGSGYAYDNASSADAMALFGCAGNPAASGMYQTTPTVNTGFLTLSVSPFVNAGTGDFRLTDTAKQTLYAAGFDIPSAWLQSLGGGGSLIGSSLIGRAR